MDGSISSQRNVADNFLLYVMVYAEENSLFPLISRLRRQLPPRGKPLSQLSFSILPYGGRLRVIRCGVFAKSDEGDYKAIFRQAK